MTTPSFLTTEQLESGLDYVRQAPADTGTLEAIFIRLTEGERDSPGAVWLTKTGGVQGDRWKTSGASMETQITLMNVRILDLICGGDRSRRGLAGDQLIVDFDLSEENLPAGQLLQVGDAVLEVSEVPHNGCRKFTERFGKNAARFVNAPETAHLHLRGINAFVVHSSSVSVSAEVRKQ